MVIIEHLDARTAARFVIETCGVRGLYPDGYRAPP
jgi:hypothetical protein